MSVPATHFNITVFVPVSGDVPFVGSRVVVYRNQVVLFLNRYNNVNIVKWYNCNVNFCMRVVLTIILSFLLY